MEYQLREYEVKKRKKKSWLSEWDSKIHPLRQRNGFEILGAWVVPKENRFVWILGWNGKESFKIADNKYYSSKARKKIQPDPARHLKKTTTSMMKTVLFRR